MNFETLLIDQDKRGVVSLTLNRPEKRNALSARMIDELTRFTSSLTPDTRAVVIQGAGKLFCAGGDLEWMNAQISADRQKRISEARKLALMLKALNEIPVPLIAKVHGAAYGGGVGLACVCDFVISSSNVKFDFAVELSKTQVSANVVVTEGDTLILSGLSEKEISSTRDGVPLLQDIPALQYIFSNERDYKLQKSILILITARKADYIYKNQSQNSEQVSSKVSSKAMKELRARYLDWFKPYPNTASVFEFMQGNALYREFRTGDVKMEKWQGSQNLIQRLSEARKFLYY